MAVISAVGIVGCDNEKDQYSGLSGLVAERNDARQAISEQGALSKKAAPKQGMYPGEDKPRILPEKKIDTTVVYEKKVEIVDSQSRQSLAHGIAYMNKNGQIVKIKVKR